jgi:hypothetical protein
MMMPLIMIMTIAPKGMGEGEKAIFQMAIEIAFKVPDIAPNTMLIIDKTKVTVHAHPVLFKSPKAIMNDTIPIAINIPPIAMATPPMNRGGIPESSMSESVKFPSLKVDGGSVWKIVTATTKAIPPKSMRIPPMILRIAIIVTPVGRDLGAACKLLYARLRYD